MNNPEPQNRKDELLAQLRKQDGTWLDIDKAASELPKLIDRGLQVLFICYEGLGTSRNMSEDFVKRGIPAVYLRRGIKELATRDEDTIQTIIDATLKVPIMVSTMNHRDYRGLSPLEKGLFDRIRAARQAQEAAFYESGPDELPPPFSEIILKALMGDVDLT